MKKYFKDHLFQLIYLIPVSFIAIGSFVLNIYLNQFGIIDVALFDSRTIFVGFIAVFQLLSFLIVLCTLVGKIDSIHDVVVLIFCIIWLPIFFSILVYMYSGNLSNIESVIEEWKYRLLNSISAASVIPFLYLIKNRYHIHNLKSADKSNKIFICIFSCFEMVSLTIAFYIACKDSIFKSIYMTYFYYSLFSIPFLLSFLGDGFPYINKKAGVALFKNEGKLEKMDYCFIFLYLLILFMITLNNYSKNIFPHISSNMGGGYYKYNTIVLEDDTIITGKIIYSNSEYIYLIEEEEKLSQYPINMINSYELTNNTSNITESPINTESEVIDNLQNTQINKGSIEQ